MFNGSIYGSWCFYFFTSDDNTLKLLGSNMVTAGWAAWMSMGSSRMKDKKELPIYLDDSKNIKV